MQNEQKRRLTVITNTNTNIIDNKASTVINEVYDSTKSASDSSGYQTNPLYEKLLSFNALQKKKRFTVEDLLKW